MGPLAAPQLTLCPGFRMIWMSGISGDTEALKLQFSVHVQHMML